MLKYNGWYAKNIIVFMYYNRILTIYIIEDQNINDILLYLL